MTLLLESVRPRVWLHLRMIAFPAMETTITSINAKEKDAPKVNFPSPTQHEAACEDTMHLHTLYCMLYSMLSSAAKSDSDDDSET